MKFSSRVILGLFGVAALATSSVKAQEYDEEGEEVIAPNFSLETVFVDSTSPLNPIILNTVKTNVEISITNEENTEAIVQVAGGALFEVGKDLPLENVCFSKLSFYWRCSSRSIS